MLGHYHFGGTGYLDRRIMESVFVFFILLKRTVQNLCRNGACLLHRHIHIDG